MVLSQKFQSNNFQTTQHNWQEMIIFKNLTLSKKKSLTLQIILWHLFYSWFLMIEFVKCSWHGLMSLSNSFEISRGGCPSKLLYTIMMTDNNTRTSKANRSCLSLNSSRSRLIIIFMVASENKNFSCIHSGEAWWSTAKI